MTEGTVPAMSAPFLLFRPEQHSNRGSGMMTTTDGWTEQDREQIAAVFGLGGGELSDATRVMVDPDDDRPGLGEWVNHFWYDGVPDYTERDYNDDGTYITVVRDEMLGAMPARLRDDDGTWVKVATFRSSGETECYSHGEINTDPTPCELCDAAPGEAHGYIYLGDGWGEIIYRLDQPTETYRDAMLAAYIACAVWSSTDDDGEPLDRSYTVDDLAPSAAIEMANDVTAFLESAWADLSDADPIKAGHDFWLTRNRHGAGYWDGDWPEPAASRLTDLAHSYGECDLYAVDPDGPDDDGMLYLTP